MLITLFQESKLLFSQYKSTLYEISLLSEDWDIDMLLTYISFITYKKNIFWFGGGFCVLVAQSFLKARSFI